MNYSLIQKLYCASCFSIWKFDSSWPDTVFSPCGYKRKRGIYYAYMRHWGKGGRCSRHINLTLGHDKLISNLKLPLFKLHMTYMVFYLKTGLRVRQFINSNKIKKTVQCYTKETVIQSSGKDWGIWMLSLNINEFRLLVYQISFANTNQINVRHRIKSVLSNETNNINRRLLPLGNMTM